MLLCSHIAKASSDGLKTDKLNFATFELQKRKTSPIMLFGLKVVIHKSTQPIASQVGINLPRTSSNGSVWSDPDYRGGLADLEHDLQAHQNLRSANATYLEFLDNRVLQVDLDGVLRGAARGHPQPVDGLGIHGVLRRPRTAAPIGEETRGVGHSVYKGIKHK